MYTEKTLDQYIPLPTKINKNNNTIPKSGANYQKTLKKLPYTQTTLNNFVGIKQSTSFTQIETQQLQNHSNSSYSKNTYSYQLSQQKRICQERRKQIQVELRRGLSEALEENDSLRGRIIQLQALYFQSCLRLQSLRQRRLLTKREKRNFSI